MKQVLSQEEIDSLLKAINSGDVPTDEMEQSKNKVKPYDFRRPFKLSREYIDTLYMIFENYAKLAGISLSNQIFDNVEMTVKAIEQISFDEFLRSVSNATVMGIFKTKPLPGDQIIAMSPSLCVQIIERMCGGASFAGFNEEKKTSFTDIEISIVEEVMTGALKSFEVAWNEIIPVETELGTIGSNPQVVQVISPNEPVVLITLVVEVGTQSNFINICIPYMSFDNIIDKLSLKNRFKHNQRSIDEYQDLMRKHMMNVPIGVEVSLGKSIITVEDVLQLEMGDIIQLDMNINEPLGMFVENLEYYKVKPGKIDGKLAVEVLEYIEEEDDI